MYSFWKKQQCRKIWHNCLQNTRYQKNNDNGYWKVVNKQINYFFYHFHVYYFKGFQCGGTQRDNSKDPDRVFELRVWSWGLDETK